MNLLLEAGAGADVNTQPDILIKAAAYGRAEWVEFLIKEGVDVNYQNVSGNTAVIRAAEWGHLACLQILIKAGADMNKARYDGSTALALSAQWGKLTCVEFLIKAGADVNTKNRHGCTAAKCQSIQCVEAIYVFHNTLTQYIIDGIWKWGQEPNRKLCMLLFAAGERVQTTREGYVIKHRRRTFWPSTIPCQIYPVPEYLKNTSPGLCLKEKCREVIRSHLLKMDLHQNLFVRVPTLGLPPPLSKYFLYGY